MLSARPADGGPRTGLALDREAQPSASATARRGLCRVAKGRGCAPPGV